MCVFWWPNRQAGICYEVAIKREMRCFSFAEGWETFAKQNKLDDKQFCILKYRVELAVLVFHKLTGNLILKIWMIPPPQPLSHIQPSQGTHHLGTVIMEGEEDSEMLDANNTPVSCLSAIG